jgi:hypothetical protein
VGLHNLYSSCKIVGVIKWFHKMWGNSCLAKRLSASQEEPSFIKLFFTDNEMEGASGLHGIYKKCTQRLAEQSPRRRQLVRPRVRLKERPNIRALKETACEAVNSVQLAHLAHDCV